MTKKLTVLTVGQRPNGSFFVAYDGQFLGDDRGFQTRELAESELSRRLEKDATDAKKFERPLLYRRESSPVGKATKLTAFDMATGIALALSVFGLCLAADSAIAADDGESFTIRVIGHGCRGANGPLFAAEEDQLPLCVSVEPIAPVTISAESI